MPSTASAPSAGSRQPRTSARGSRFAFVQLSDMTGVFEITLFSEILAQTRTLLDSGQPLIVTLDGLELRSGGILADVAPTVLDLLGIPQPAPMTGVTLIADAE